MEEVRSHSSKNLLISENVLSRAKANRILLGANSIVNLFTIDE